jgi:hypothetical protein
LLAQGGSVSAPTMTAPIPILDQSLAQARALIGQPNGVRAPERAEYSDRGRTFKRVAAAEWRRLLNETLPRVNLLLLTEHEHIEDETLVVTFSLTHVVYGVTRTLTRAVPLTQAPTRALAAQWAHTRAVNAVARTLLWQWDDEDEAQDEPGEKAPAAPKPEESDGGPVRTELLAPGYRKGTRVWSMAEIDAAVGYEARSRDESDWEADVSTVDVDGTRYYRARWSSARKTPWGSVSWLAWKTSTLEPAEFTCRRWTKVSGDWPSHPDDPKPEQDTRSMEEVMGGETLPDIAPATSTQGPSASPQAATDGTRPDSSVESGANSPQRDTPSTEEARDAKEPVTVPPLGLSPTAPSEALAAPPLAAEPRTSVDPAGADAAVEPEGVAGVHALRPATPSGPTLTEALAARGLTARDSKTTLYGKDILNAAGEVVLDGATASRAWEWLHEQEARDATCHCGAEEKDHSLASSCTSFVSMNKPAPEFPLVGDRDDRCPDCDTLVPADAPHCPTCGPYDEQLRCVSCEEPLIGEPADEEDGGPLCSKCAPQLALVSDAPLKQPTPAALVRAEEAAEAVEAKTPASLLSMTGGQMRAEKWRLRPLRKARRDSGGCAECGHDIQAGDDYRDGVAKPEGASGMLSPRGVPYGKAHESCVARLAGEEVKA